MLADGQRVRRAERHRPVVRDNRIPDPILKREDVPPQTVQLMPLGTLFLDGIGQFERPPEELWVGHAGGIERDQPGRLRVLPAAVLLGTDNLLDPPLYL